MLIEEVIDRADALCLNNEYDRELKYHWCDVVGAEITQMYKPEYVRVHLERWTDGLFLLPEGCRYENVIGVIAGGREIPKKDMRTQGYWIIYGVRDRFFLEDRSKHADEIEVVYLKDYENIRRFELENERLQIKDGKAVGFISHNIELPIIAGDVLRVTIDGKSYTFNVFSREMVVDDSGTSLHFEAVSDYTGVSGASTVDTDVAIERIVTDTTECASPWDEMYIDYICGQICFYQRDMAEYQQYMARYNSRMDEYSRFIKAREPSDDGKFKNWWEL